MFAWWCINIEASQSHPFLFFQIKGSCKPFASSTLCEWKFSIILNEEFSKNTALNSSEMDTDNDVIFLKC